MKNVALFTITLLLLFSSCSKDAINAKKLEGIWTVNSLKINNVEFISASSTVEVTFDYKSGNSGRYNTVTHLLNVLVGDVSGDFTISGNGEKITLKEDGSTALSSGSILEITNSKFHMTYVDEDDNVIIFKATKK